MSFSAVLFPAGAPEAFAYPSVYVADPGQPGAPRRVGPNPPPQPPNPGQPDYSGPGMFTLIGGGAAWATGNPVPKEASAPQQPPAPGTCGPDPNLRRELPEDRVSNPVTVQR